MPGVKTPFGTVPKSGVYLAVIAGGGAMVYAYVKKKNKAKTAAATAQTPANTGQQYGYGSTYAYGNYGYGAYTYEPYGYGFGPSGLGEYPGGSYYGYGYYGAGVPVEVPQQASTNAQWSQATVSALTAQGYTGQTVLGALGPYLTGKQVTPAQEQIIQAAIAVEGYPPIPGPSGNPPGIVTAGSGGGGTGQGGGDTQKVPVPNVVGGSAGDAHNLIVAAQLRPASRPSSINDPSFWKVTSQTPKAGTQVRQDSTVTFTAVHQKNRV